MAALAGSGASRDELTAELTANLRAALARWGLGLHHLTHEAQLSGEGENADIVFLTDGRPVANLSGGVAALARAYGDMTAP
ncbi:UNVERIFIED_CONTAM: DNA repair protein, partial [Prevotella sp. 15_C9]